MNFQDFFALCKDAQSLRLVGPLCESEAEVDLPVIYIDGGLKFKPPTPHVSISLGDGDSSPKEPDILLSPEKDFSDLAFALENIPTDISILQLDGFLGGRRDHEWINLGVIHNFLAKRARPTKVALDRAIWAVSKGEWNLDFQGGFSLLCFDHTTLSLNGDVKYPYNNSMKFPKLSSHGLSNLSNGCILLNCEAPVFLLLNP